MIEHTPTDWDRAHADAAADAAAGRETVSFRSGGLRCAAWLYRPDGPGPHPVVTMAHGGGAVRQVRLDAYARRFREAGYGVLCFDYRHWGASEGEPRQLLHIPRQLDDIAAAIAAARALPWADPARVVLWGTSFGGGHAVVAGARHPELAGVVAQCAVADALAIATSTPPALVARWVLAALRDAAGAALGRRPRYIPLAGEPGEAAVMTKLGAEASYRAMLDGGPSPWANAVAARAMLSVPLYRPIRHAAKVRPPLLMVVCDRDEICPGALQARCAELAPRGRAVRFDSTHFSVYFGEEFERAVAAMLAFLREVAPPAATDHAEPRASLAPA